MFTLQPRRNVSFTSSTLGPRPNVGFTAEAAVPLVSIINDDCFCQKLVLPHLVRHESLTFLRLTTIGPRHPQGNRHERNDGGTSHTTTNQNTNTCRGNNKQTQTHPRDQITGISSLTQSGSCRTFFSEPILLPQQLPHHITVLGPSTIRWSSIAASPGLVPPEVLPSTPRTRLAGHMFQKTLACFSSIFTSCGQTTLMSTATCHPHSKVRH